MKNLECPHCGSVISDEELKALWGKRNAMKTSPAKADASRRNGIKGGEAAKAMWEARRQAENA